MEKIFYKIIGYFKPEYIGINKYRLKSKFEFFLWKNWQWWIKIKPSERKRLRSMAKTHFKYGGYYESE